MNPAESFNAASADYAAVRPGYPEAVYDFLIDATDLSIDGELLEVGVGTGQATVGFARRGFKILGLEPGQALATEARHQLGSYPNVCIQESSFEQWNPACRRFALLFSAHAYHWIEPAAAVNKPRDLLADEGWIALIWNIPVIRTPSPLRAAIDHAYESHAPHLIRQGASSSEKASGRVGGYFNASGIYKAVADRRFPWSKKYTSNEYTQLLGTYSDHITLRREERDALLDAVGRAIAGAGGTMEVNYETRCLLYRLR